MMFQKTSKIDICIVLIAAIFMLISIACLVIPFYCFCYLDWCIGVSMTFATLSGAILVFKTISLHNKSLEEEKRKNIIQRFDSQFFAILSQWRNDALQVKFTTKYLDKKLNGRINHLESIGENAFSIAKSTLNTIYNTISNKNAIIFDYEVYIDEIKQEELKLEFVKDCENEYKKVKQNILNIINVYQGIFLCSQLGLSNTECLNLNECSKNEQIKYILDKILEEQDISFNKYIQTLSFLTTLIKEMPEESDRYLNHIKCLLGKEENEFLKYCNLRNF